MTSFDDKLAVLRQRFLARAGDEASQLAAAMEAGGREDIRLISHRLAGAAGVFGFPEVGQAASAVEDALDRNAPAAELDRHCHALLDRLRLVTSAGEGR